MNRKQQGQVQMFGRVGTFWEHHKDQFPEGSAGDKAFAAVKAARAQCEEADAATSPTREDGSVSKRLARRRLLSEVTAVVRTARAIAEDTPGADANFQRPVKTRDTALLATARGFVADLEPVKATFVEHGLPGTFVDDLRKAIDQFAQAIDGRFAGRIGKGNAQTALRTAIRQGMKAVRLLDVTVLNVVGAGSPVFDEWRRVRRIEVVGSRTTATTADTPPAPVVTTTATPEAA